MKNSFHLVTLLLIICVSVFAFGSIKKEKEKAWNTLSNEAAEVVVTPFKTTMLADGKDTVRILITAVDKQGAEVTNADNLVHFFCNRRCESYCCAQ